MIREVLLVPRLQPQNTLVWRLLPPPRIAGGRSLRNNAFQGWSPGTRTATARLRAATTNLLLHHRGRILAEEVLAETDVYELPLH